MKGAQGSHFCLMEPCRSREAKSPIIASLSQTGGQVGCSQDRCVYKKSCDSGPKQVTEFHLASNCIVGIAVFDFIDMHSTMDITRSRELQKTTPLPNTQESQDDYSLRVNSSWDEAKKMPPKSSGAPLQHELLEEGKHSKNKRWFLPRCSVSTI